MDKRESCEESNEFGTRLIIFFVVLIISIYALCFMPQPFPTEKALYRVNMELVNGREVEGVYELPKGVRITIGSSHGSYYAKYTDKCDFGIIMKCSNSLKTGALYINKVTYIKDAD